MLPPFLTKERRRFSILLFQILPVPNSKRLGRNQILGFNIQNIGSGFYSDPAPRLNTVREKNQKRVQIFMIVFSYYIAEKFREISRRQEH
jgi:hypothetical protein